MGDPATLGTANGPASGAGGGAASHAGTMLRALLEKKRASDTRVCGLAFTFWLLATCVLLVAIAGMILHDSDTSMPVVSLLAHLPGSTLQWVATSCAILSSGLFMNFMKLRQEQTRHTFLLALVMDGHVRDAAALLFRDKDGRGGLALEAASEAFGMLQ